VYAVRALALAVLTVFLFKLAAHFHSILSLIPIFVGIISGGFTAAFCIVTFESDEDAGDRLAIKLCRNELRQKGYNKFFLRGGYKNLSKKKIYHKTVLRLVELMRLRERDLINLELATLLCRNSPLLSHGAKKIHVERQ